MGGPLRKPPWTRALERRPAAYRKMLMVCLHVRSANVVSASVIVVALMLAPSLARAAQSTATVVGSVHDETGAAMQDVRITLQGPAGRAANTRSTGEFEFRDLPAGAYQISAEAAGFLPALRAIQVQAGDRTTVTMTLHVAGLTETIVTAAKTGTSEVQKLPMAVTAVRGEELTRVGAVTIDQVAALAPSVTFTQN